jgi:hypothetical protein
MTDAEIPCGSIFPTSEGLQNALWARLPMSGMLRVPMLEAHPGIRAIAVLGELLRRHPEIGPQVRRTLE